MNTMTTDEFVTASEASRILGVSHQRIANMIRDHEIDAIRPWPRTLLIRRVDLDEWQRGVRLSPLGKTAVRRWLAGQGVTADADIATVTVSVRQFIDEKRPNWDDASKDNWTDGMMTILAR